MIDESAKFRSKVSEGGREGECEICWTLEIIISNYVVSIIQLLPGTTTTCTHIRTLSHKS